MNATEAQSRANSHRRRRFAAWFVLGFVGGATAVGVADRDGLVDRLATSLDLPIAALGRR